MPSRGEATPSNVLLAPGTLLASARSRAVRALESGALISIPSESEELEDGGVRFRVRIAESLERKLADGAARRRDPRRGDDPFLPYDEDLFVADVTPTHLCLLNKYRVVDQHLLLVTRRFEEQESPLDLDDFEALWACMAEFEALAFYNSGRIAGASQRHKHLQLVPVPLGSGPERVPIERRIRREDAARAIGAIPGLPFRHRLAQLSGCADAPPEEAARLALRRYRDLLAELDLDGASGPYNLLATRDWMLAIPRVAEAWEGIEVNALGFAGALLVRDRAQRSRVREVGPMHLLRAVGADPD